MYIKFMLWAGVLLLSATFLFSSCQSSKIAYGNSYYFKQTTKPVEKPSAEPVKESTLEASIEIEEISSEDVATKMEEAQQQISTIVEQSNNPALKESVTRTQQLAKEMKNDQLTKKEVRAKRKELRKEIKTLTKEFKNAAPEEKNEIDRNLKLALIFFGVALILSIIGGVSTVGTIFWVLSSIAWIAGIVFFVIWLINEVG
jgi:cation transport ATPase